MIALPDLSADVLRCVASRLPRQNGLVVGSMLVGIGSATAYSASHVLRAVGVNDWNEPWLGAAIGALSGFAVLLIARHRQWARYAHQIRAHPIGARNLATVAGIGITLAGLLLGVLYGRPEP